MRFAVCLLMWAAATGLASPVQAAPAPGAGQITRFQHAVQYLQDAAPELRSDFALIALSNLADAYQAEAQLAREAARKAARHTQLWAWSATVDRYAGQMSLLQEDIELGLPVRLTLSAEKFVAITVADRTVILSHPRLNEQGVFEQDILMAFCASHNCEQFTPEDVGVDAIPRLAQQIRPSWAFTAQESLCAYQGIAVRFKGARNMANSRLICEQFLQEVMTLTDELAWQQRHAVSIEWDQLEIQPTPQRPEHMLQLNTLGDTALVTVPLLYHSSGLFRQVLPWIRQRVTQQQEITVDLDADDYDWQKP